MKESRKLREISQTFRTKRADMKFDMESDTEELDRLKLSIKSIESNVGVQKLNLKLGEMKVKDDFIITKMIEELFENGDMCSE